MPLWQPEFTANVPARSSPYGLVPAMSSDHSSARSDGRSNVGSAVVPVVRQAFDSI